jgi:hypothetical protein
VSTYIQEFEGEPEQEEESYDDDLDEEEGKEIVNYLTTAAFLHRATAEDIYSLEPEGFAEQFILEDRYRTMY